MAFRSSPSSQLLATFLLIAIVVSPMLVVQSEAARTSRKLLCLLCSMGPMPMIDPMPMQMPMQMPMPMSPQSGGWNWNFGWSCQKIKVGFFWTIACGFNKHKGIGTGPMAGGAGPMTGGTGASSSSTTSSSSSSP